MIGKRRRLGRILRNGRTVIVPMDHGITKPEAGLENIDSLIGLIENYVDAVVLHKGVAKSSEILQNSDVALIIHLSASTKLGKPENKKLVTSVEKAIALGADGVSVHVNIGAENEGEQLEKLGLISEICDSYGMPLLVMSYPKGDRNLNTVKHAARVAYELGADIVKVPFVEEMDEVVEYAKIPVVIAGGGKTAEADFFRMVEKALICGAAGVAAGRNVFQSENPTRVVRILHKIVHEGVRFEEVVSYVEGSDR